MVFPLRIVYGFGAADITNDWIPSPFTLHPELWLDELRLIFIMFGVSWAWLSGVIVAMFVYSLKQREHLDLNDAERDNANSHIWAFAILGFAGILSIVIALTVSSEWVKLAGYQYFLLLSLVFVKRFRRLPWARSRK